jgi:Fe-S-cluster containining protein
MIVYVNVGELSSGTDGLSEDTCLECGAHCCRLGGVVATQNEVDAIIQRGFPNHFIQLADDIFGIEWSEDGTCTYLENDKCTIYPVRPLGCRMFPVVQEISGGIVLIECRLGSELSEEELVRRKRILEQRPLRIIRESDNHRDEHASDLLMKSTKYSQKIL